METNEALPTTTSNPANKFVEQRRERRLDGICQLMVEYGVTLEELEEYFLYSYETQAAKSARKRTKQNQAPIRKERSARAIGTRWAKYEAMKTSHLDKKAADLARTAAVPKPVGFDVKPVVKTHVVGVDVGVPE